MVEVTPSGSSQSKIELWQSRIGGERKVRRSPEESSLKRASDWQRAMTSAAREVAIGLKVCGTGFTRGSRVLRYSHAVHQSARRFRWDCPGRNGKGQPVGNVCWA